MYKLWNEIIQSLKGKEYDYTKINLGRSIIILSIPMVIEMISESLFALVDIYFVTKLGADAVSIVGITEAIMTIIYAIGMGLSIATTGIIARRIGEHQYKKASITSTHAIYIAFTFSIFVAIPGIFFPKQILLLMGTNENTVNAGFGYTRIMISSNVLVMLLFVNNAIFRSAGNAFIAMWVMLIANLANIILDPCLISGLGPFPKLGVKGAAIATVIGRGTGVLIQFYFLMKGNKKIKLIMASFIPDIATIKKILKQSLGGIGQYILSTSSWIILYGIMTKFGNNAVAGYTIAIRIIVFALLPVWGLSNAAATLVGQNLGAKQPLKAEKAVWVISLIGAFILAVTGIIFINFTDEIVSLFNPSIGIKEMAIMSLRILSYGYIFYAFGMVMSNAFNGAGDTITPTLLNFFCYWLIEIPLAFILSFTMKFQQNGVIWAIVCSETLLAVIATILFKKGRWKLLKV